MSTNRIEQPKQPKPSTVPPLTPEQQKRADEFDQERAEMITATLAELAERVATHIERSSDVVNDLHPDKVHKQNPHILEHGQQCADHPVTAAMTPEQRNILRSKLKPCPECRHMQALAYALRMITRNACLEQAIHTSSEVSAAGMASHLTAIGWQPGQPLPESVEQGFRETGKNDPDDPDGAKFKAKMLPRIEHLMDPTRHLHVDFNPITGEIRPPQPPPSSKLDGPHTN